MATICMTGKRHRSPEPLRRGLIRWCVGEHACGKRRLAGFSLVASMGWVSRDRSDSRNGWCVSARTGAHIVRIWNQPFRPRILVAAAVALAFASAAAAQTVSLLIPHQVKLESVDYLGKRAVKITED